MGAPARNFAFAALEIGMCAKAGHCTHARALEFARCALTHASDDAARSAATEFLTGVLRGDARGAGASLLDWVSAAYPVQPPAAHEFAWQGRADCGFD